jgi:hypothetical protein
MSKINSFDNFKIEYEKYYKKPLVSVNINIMNQFVIDNVDQTIEMFKFVIKQLIEIIFKVNEPFNKDFYLNPLIQFNRYSARDYGSYKSVNLFPLIKTIILKDEPMFITIIEDLTAYNTPRVRTTIVNNYILHINNFIYAYDNKKYKILEYLIRLYSKSKSSPDIIFDDLINSVIKNRDSEIFIILIKYIITRLNDRQIIDFFDLLNAYTITDSTIKKIIKFIPILNNSKIKYEEYDSEYEPINASQRISEILINLFTKSNIKNKVRFHKILINYIGTRFIDNILSIIDEEYLLLKKKYLKYKKKYIALQKNINLKL